MKKEDTNCRHTEPCGWNEGVRPSGDDPSAPDVCDGAETERLDTGPALFVDVGAGKVHLDQAGTAEELCRLA